MPLNIRIMDGHAPANVVATFALGALGSLAGLALGLPLGALLGALFAVALAAGLRIPLLGAPPAVPQHWRFALVPIVGVAIGAGVPADVLDQMRAWVPSLLLLMVFVPAAHALSLVIHRRLGRLDRPTGFFAAMPGGYIESLQMGEEAGADMPMLIMLQFLRLILCIVLVPLVFALVTGHAVGSGSGVPMPGADVPLGVRDVLILTFCAVAGYAGGHLLRLPAAVISGPLLLSGLAHATGLTGATPPEWMILVTQWVVGTALGTRFAGLDRRRFWTALWLSVVSMGAIMALVVAIALALADRVGETVTALILAFAPGGISEMSLVAISLQVSAVYVTLHHILRIVWAVVVTRLAWRFIPQERL